MEIKYFLPELKQVVWYW